MFRRYGLFFLVNIGVMLTIGIVTSVLGLNTYITQYGFDYGQLAGFCLVWGMGGSFISLFMSKWMAKMAYGVQIVGASTGHSHLVSRVHALAKAAGLPKPPEVGIYDSPDVNAFATGPSRSNSLVAVSTGLLHSMNDDEVEGVLAHEVAHIANGDMVTMTLLQGIVNAFVMFFARIAAFALQNFLRGDDDEGEVGPGGLAYHISVFVFQILFSFISMFFIAYFSRMREFRADEGGARLAGRDKMQAALVKLKRQFEGPAAQSAFSDDSFATMKISNKSSFWALLSTHPNLDDRIRALQSR